MPYHQPAALYIAEVFALRATITVCTHENMFLQNALDPSQFAEPA